MLLRFSVENWMSFRNNVTLSMIASNERQHRDRLPHIPKYRLRLLPIASVYGGNASGKTNLFKAVAFAKRFIIEGIRRNDVIPLEPFALDESSESEPSKFEFEILVNEVIYRYRFVLTKKQVIEECLERITSTSEKQLYIRKQGKIKFDSALKAKNERLEPTFKGTQDNQLFLTNSVSQKINEFFNVFNWFDKSLLMITPNARYSEFEKIIDEDHPLFEIMNSTLPQLDTGIQKLCGEEISMDSAVFNDLKEKIAELQDGSAMRVINTKDNERYWISRNDGRIQGKKMITHHLSVDGNPVKFAMSQESDGTMRIIDLVPAFLQISKAASHNVIVIDEVDRSLHTLVTRSLIEMYLNTCCEKSRAQLLLTTHDVLTMDQHLLRRDEMWVTERDNDGCSRLFSFSDFIDVRYDKDIRKSYLQGRLGGIPNILLTEALDLQPPAYKGK